MFLVSCNFERKHFIKPNFVKHLQEICEQYGVSPKYLAIELLEGRYSDMDAVQATVQELNKSGFKVYLDDCGAPDSAMGDLSFHSISHVKIGKELVDRIQQRHIQIFLKSFCNIAHKMSYTVVCEGVETQQQLEIVRNCNVDLVQGYYFFKPMDISCAQQLYDALSC